ncbi:MAG: anti-sigma factor [Candidatus Rokubacteria bacterium]|nr:anti-sigma factor [Candidatus Rokubacteria bacterium]
MSHEPFDTLAAVYAVGALDGGDLARFEAHLREGCSTCETIVRESSEALAGLARERPPVIPPAHVREALIRRVDASSRPRTSRRRWIPWALGTAAAAVAAAAFTAGMVASRYEARLGVLARETAQVREQLRREQALLREEVAAARAVADLLRMPATRVVALNGLAAAPTASGRIIWHDQAGGRLYVNGLPPAPEGKTYELWTIAGAAPRPAGTFDVDTAGRASRPVMPPDDGPVKVFAVTLEPAGGVPAPTGPMVLASAK